MASICMYFIGFKKMQSINIGIEKKCRFVSKCLVSPITNVNIYSSWAPLSGRPVMFMKTYWSVKAEK